jgi:hypothetical protein
MVEHIGVSLESDRLSPSDRLSEKGQKLGEIVPAAAGQSLR